MTIDHDTRPSTFQHTDLSGPGPRTRHWAVPASLAAVAAVAAVGVTQFQDDTPRNPSSLAVPASEVAMTKSQALDQKAIVGAVAERVNVSNDRQTEFAPIVIGMGPKAVYVGPAPTFGDDPARGETDDSYFARTRHHLPGLSSAAAVDGPWWYGPAPVTGGDPALGETDDSYFARTGRHLPTP